jgi:predicted dehydrogenase
MPSRWAIIGGGNIATSHAIALQRSRSAQLVGIADIEPAARARAESAFGIPAFATAESMLDELKPDAVTIALPHALHLFGARVAAERGVHVLCEKPLAPSVDESRELIDTCQRSGVHLGAILNNRGYPQTRWIRQIVTDGSLGARTFTVTLALGAMGTARRRDGGLGGTMLLGAGIHYLDLLRWWFGPLEEVAAVADLTGDAVSVAALRFRSGVTGVFRTSSVGSHGRPAHIEIDGDRGSVSLTGATIVRVDGDLGPPPPALPAVDGMRFGPGHLVVIDEAAKALEDGLPFPVTGEDGLEAVAICDAIYSASHRRAMTPA